VNQASIVYMALGRLLLDLPGRVAYHRLDPRLSHWPNWVDGERVGFESHATYCGQLIYRERDHRLAGIRLDNAQLVGRACVRCWKYVA
jgi:hypothetical protein